MGKLNEAEQSYENSLKIQPNNLNALHYLASVQEKLGGDKLELALKNFSKYYLNIEYLEQFLKILDLPQPIMAEG